MNNAEAEDDLRELNEIEMKLSQYEKEIKEIEGIRIKIRALCPTQYGENVFVCTNSNNWDCTRAFPLKWTNGNFWIGDFSLLELGLEYKLIKKTSTNEVIWESFEMNRQIGTKYISATHEILLHYSKYLMNINTNTSIDLHEINTVHPQTYIYDTKVKIYEDESHEFKQLLFPSVPEVLPKLKKLMKYLCAFLNSNSGVLYIGITDDGFIKGTKLNDELYNELEYQISDMINHFEDHVINERYITYQFNRVLSNAHSNKYVDDLYVVVIFVKVGLPDHIYTTPLKDDDYQDYLCYIKLNGTIKMITGNNLYKYIKNKIKKYVMKKLIKN